MKQQLTNIGAAFLGFIILVAAFLDILPPDIDTSILTTTGISLITSSLLRVPVPEKWTSKKSFKEDELIKSSPLPNLQQKRKSPTVINAVVSIASTVLSSLLTRKK
jgi:hypothetical protein